MKSDKNFSFGVGKCDAYSFEDGEEEAYAEMYRLRLGLSAIPKQIQK